MQFHFVCLGCKKLLKHPICTDCGPKVVIDRLPETKQAFRAGAPLGGWGERKIYGKPVDNGKPTG